MMTVISTVADPETLSLTVVAEFEASPERVWGVWENPRHLERCGDHPVFPRRLRDTISRSVVNRVIT